MHIEINLQQKTNLFALEEILSLPLMLNSPLYRNYPAMKLGQRRPIDFFSRKLCVIAAELLQNGRNQNWTITAPPYYYLPSAANLLSRRIHDLLLQQGFILSLNELRHNPQQPIAIRSQEEFKNYYDYSKNNLDQRIAERQRAQQTLDTHGLIPRFKDRSVIIINDINVTGTQQYFMQQTLDRLQVHACFWLYIFDVEKALAKRHPEVEHQINHSQIKDLDSYAKILANGQTEHTARCISRLFNENIGDFRYLIASLNTETRTRLYQLAQREGRYRSSIFDEKMQLLATGHDHIHAS